MPQVPVAAVPVAAVAAVPAVTAATTSSVPSSQGFLYGRAPVKVMCVHCNTETLTNVKFDTGLGTWAICCGTAAFGCWLGCCLIPFCIDDLKDAVHQCGNCQRVVGERRLIS